MFIQENCIYIQGTKEYKNGEIAPIVRDGDIYRCGDYEYKYNHKASLLKDSPWLRKEYSGWGVRVLDKSKVEYGEILSEINERPVVSLHNTFYECENMKTAPSIPESIEDLWGTYSGCISLKSSPIIPKSVQKMQWAFEYCESLTKIPEIPEHIQDLTGTFADCRHISSQELPDHITTKIEKIFIGC